MLIIKFTVGQSVKNTLQCIWEYEKKFTSQSLIMHLTDATMSFSHKSE